MRYYTVGGMGCADIIDIKLTFPPPHFPFPFSTLAVVVSESIAPRCLIQGLGLLLILVLALYLYTLHSVNASTLKLEEVMNGEHNFSFFPSLFFPLSPYGDDVVSEPRHTEVVAPWRVPSTCYFVLRKLSRAPSTLF